MINEFEYIEENYKQIQNEINEAKIKYRKETDVIGIMAVTKTVDARAVNFAVNCGINLLGENRVQEYLSKKGEYQKNTKVHFIGHLQSNKIKYIIDSMDVIESVDSISIAKELDRQAKKLNIIKNIFVEVNIGKEESKSGIFPDGLEDFLYQIAEFNNIKVEGLMTIPPKIDTEKYFDKMGELFIDISTKKIDNINMSVLSMGMSADYALAVKHGSNMVRIGTGLFGARR